MYIRLTQPQNLNPMKVECRTWNYLTNLKNLNQEPAASYSILPQDGDQPWICRPARPVSPSALSISVCFAWGLSSSMVTYSLVCVEIIEVGGKDLTATAVYPGTLALKVPRHALNDSKTRRVVHARDDRSPMHGCS